MLEQCPKFCAKLSIKSQELHQCPHSNAIIIDYEQNSDSCSLVSLLIT